MTENLFRLIEDKDACGTGFVALVGENPEPSHSVIVDALSMVCDYTHRGGFKPVEDNKKVGDGAGIMLSIPRKFLSRIVNEESGVELSDDFGCGHLFLSQDIEVRKLQEEIITRELEATGIAVEAWRNVPVNEDILPIETIEKMPAIRQVLFSKPEGFKDKSSESVLYVIYHKINQALKAAGLERAEFCSFSYNSVVYKGMLTSPQLTEVFPDLLAEDAEAVFGIIHSRYSTNTAPEWRLAHPNWHVAHNGEINSCTPSAQAIQAEWNQLGLDWEFPTYRTDSGQLDEAVRYLVSKGYSIDEAMIALVQPAWERAPELSKEARSVHTNHALQTQPWDGPALLIYNSGDTVGARLDASGLRPNKYILLTDPETGIKRIIFGSESTRVGYDTSHVTAYGRIEAGQSISLDVATGVISSHDEIVDRIYASQQTNLAARIRNIDISTTDQALDNSHGEFSISAAQRAYGWHAEARDTSIAYMMANGDAMTAAMGSDFALPFLSAFPWPVEEFLRECFVQVTAPPKDTLNEKADLSMEVFAGGKPEFVDGDVVRFETAILPFGGTDALIEKYGSETEVLDATYAITTDDHADDLQNAILALQEAAVSAAKSGKRFIVIDDSNISSVRQHIPGVLAVAAVNSALLENNLKLKTSIHAKLNSTHTVHHQAVAMSVGADTVEPVMMYKEVDRVFSSNQAPADFTREQALKNIHAASVKSLEGIMGQVGFHRARVYSGAHQLEGLGINLDDPILGSILSGISSPIGGYSLQHFALNQAVFHADAMAHLSAENLQFKGQSRMGPQGAGETHRLSPAYVTEYKKYEAGSKLSSKTGMPWLNFETPDGTKLDGVLPAEFINDWTVAKPAQNFYDFVSRTQREKPTSLCDALQIKSSDNAIELAGVTTTNMDIIARMTTGAMSIGALTSGDDIGSPKAHEDIGYAQNRLSTKSDTGEGGEPEYRWYQDGGRLNSGIKQVASGRNGVTAEYMANADELEIKLGQGAKPGKGGQLPAAKVTPMIAKLRRTTPGVGLMSPATHHDIYSIEDLEQLVHDLKSSLQLINAEDMPAEFRGRTYNLDVNLNNKFPAGTSVSVNFETKAVIVKLVAKQGIGTIAAGVAKAGADEIIVGGADGGTGSAKDFEINNVGMPWEIGLSEVEQTLTKLGLRDKVKLKVGGGITVPEDMVKAAILGADKWEFGTTAMIGVGCVMIRRCGTPGACYVGVANSPEAYKSVDEHGFPAHEQLMRDQLNRAAGVREIMAKLGIDKFEDLRGRTDLLEGKMPEHVLGNINFEKLLWRAERGSHPQLPNEPRYADRVELQYLDQVFEYFNKPQPVRGARDSADKIVPQERLIIDVPELHNCDRSFGGVIATMAAHAYHNPKVERNLGGKMTPPRMDAITIRTHGDAGQSYGFAAWYGMRFEHEGTVQDGAFKSACGGEHVIRFPKDFQGKSNENVIAGNAFGYGASDGRYFVAGRVGDRACVMGAGLTAVFEGVGKHFAEFFKSGTLLNIGEFGENYGSGMKGGIIYQYDPDNKLAIRKSADVNIHQIPEPNPDKLDYKGKTYDSSHANNIKTLMERHVKLTGSPEAQRILDNWEQERSNFRMVEPVELAKIREAKDDQKIVDIADVLTTHQNGGRGMREWTRSELVRREIGNGRLSPQGIGK